jgi:hypothetical protein
VICANETVTLTATPGAAYLWSTGSQEQSIVVGGTTASYSVTVWDEEGCPGVGQVMITADDCVGTGEHASAPPHGISVYPNPVRRNEPVRLAVSGISAGTHTVGLTDISGKSVYRTSLRMEDDGEVPLPLPALSPGVYLLRMTEKTGAEFVTRMVVY